jgi:hypothetical protein
MDDPGRGRTDGTRRTTDLGVWRQGYGRAITPTVDFEFTFISILCRLVGGPIPWMLSPPAPEAFPCSELHPNSIGSKLHRAEAKLIVNTGQGGFGLKISTQTIAVLSGLFGILTGGVITALTSRANWRREARLKAYSAVLTSSNTLYSVLRSVIERKSESDRLPEDAIAECLSAHDTASLLASYKVMYSLEDWRADVEVSERMVAKSTDPNSQSWAAFARGWQEHAKEFRKCSKMEFGVRGRRFYQVWTIAFSLMAGSAAAVLLDHWPKQWTTTETIAFWIAFTAMIIAAFSAARARLTALSFILVVAVIGLVQTSNDQPVMESALFLNRNLLLILVPGLTAGVPIWVWSADFVSRTLSRRLDNAIDFVLDLRRP